MASAIAIKWTIADRFIQWLRFRQVAGAISSKDILVDLGCGTGAFLRSMQSRIQRGIGVDAAIESIEVSPRLSFLQNDLGRPLPLDDDSVDTVTALAVVEHLNDPEPFIREAHRILKPGGLLILTTPSPRARPLLEFLAYRIHVISEADIADHKHYYSSEELRELLSPFATVDAQTFQFGFNHVVRAHK